jgi:hypothetical protein
MDRPRFVTWSFNHYLDIAPPSFALESPPAVTAAPTAITA